MSVCLCVCVCVCAYVFLTAVKSVKNYLCQKETVFLIGKFTRQPFLIFFFFGVLLCCKRALTNKVPTQTTVFKMKTLKKKYMTFAKDLGNTVILVQLGNLLQV